MTASSPPSTAPRKLESALFCGLVLVHLLPVWLFRYLPTQDSPLHLANAVILKDYGNPQTRYAEFFELRPEPLPNWTTHLLLTGLLHLVAPLVAEKILVSAYVIGFAWSFRYFLGAFGVPCRTLAPAGLLFLFNRCFLMGFYNYCLSLILVWVVLGYCLRRRSDFGLAAAAVLMAWLWLAYFTHLLGYLFAAAAAAWVMATAPGRRLLRLACVAVALLPTGCLAVRVLAQPGVLGVREAAKAADGPLESRFREGLAPLWTDVKNVNSQLFEPYEPPQVPLGVLVLLFFEVLFCATLLAAGGTSASGKPVPPRWPVAVFALGIAGLYLLFPDSLSPAVGLLKARLALLPPLVWLACLRLPGAALPRRLLMAGMLLSIALNLGLVLRHFQAANRDIAEYTAGIPLSGQHRVLAVVQGGRTAPLADYLEHAADYYCLTTGNVNLDNFQATLHHFPVRFRPGVQRGRGDIDSYPGREVVDLILAWDCRPSLPSLSSGSWEEVYHQGRLSLFVRRRPRVNDGVEDAPRAPRRERQGKRTSKPWKSQEFRQTLYVPSPHFLFDFQRVGRVIRLQQGESQTVEEGNVLTGYAIIHPTRILTKHDIQHPMQAILDAPGTVPSK